MNKDLLIEKIVHNGPLDNLFYFDELDSTNIFAKEYITQNPDSDNILFLTSYQKKGIGRFSRKWISSPGKNLTFTLVKKFTLSVDEIHRVNFYSSYILYYTLKDIFRDYSEMKFTLKWPNDLLLNGKKVSGFLLELKDISMPDKIFIIGCGLNMNERDLDESISVKSTSLARESDVEIKPEIILIEYVKNFYGNIPLLDEYPGLMDKWKSGSALIGKNIEFRKYDDETPDSGTVENIDNNGALCLRYPDGSLKRFYSGEITLSV
ncbi:MAG: biotin--[acetyl-CoA-carboxylase] ligase [Bacteroidetes bacterium]|nr:biotin--[acetyl-CoA-carboxylase] ligase [Bacteroidota bacterium]